MNLFCWFGRAVVRLIQFSLRDVGGRRRWYLQISVKMLCTKMDPQNHLNTFGISKTPIRHRRVVAFSGGWNWSFHPSTQQRDLQKHEDADKYAAKWNLRKKYAAPWLFEKVVVLRTCLPRRFFKVQCIFDPFFCVHEDARYYTEKWWHRWGQILCSTLPRPLSKSTQQKISFAA